MKEKVLEKLSECREGYVSGEALSEFLGVSRTAVWKYIKEIKEEGYEIDASSKKGYRLVSNNDILNSFEIGHHLNTEVIGKKIEYFDKIDSTNTYAKKIAFEGCSDGTVVVADQQTAGKGRLGRVWESSAKKGIWMTVVLRPSIPPEDVQIITLGTSVAVVNAIRNITGIKADIKWPNDIVLEGRKVCGILTEMSSEQDRVNYTVIGIGVNVNHREEDFPTELRKLAVSLRSFAEEKGIDLKGLLNHGSIRRSKIIKGIIVELEKIYFKLNRHQTSEIIQTWKEFSSTLGKAVRVTIKGVDYTGMAVDLTEDGKLVVDCDDGIRREVVSGEVMVRGILGYV
ncbi:MAG: biotin--[acetyl-CoA-carboxylase] ligase [Clostridia bacterium]|nr:biotin--[acetyl-CoA-carboxylase] ligase [Clostridia bacterium]